jgi:hypothetical protein
LSSRGAYLIAAVALLLVLPWDRAWVPLVLFVAACLSAAALTPPPKPKPSMPVVVLGRDMATLGLLRRTVPKLRMRRPADAIDAQISWRQAVDAGRRRRETFGGAR